MVEGKAFEVWGGEQLRDFTYVDDCINAMLLAAASEEANGRIFNLGGDCVVTLKDLAECLVKITDGNYQVKQFPQEHKRIDIGDYYSNYLLIETMLGWKPQTGLKEGLRKTIDYYNKNLGHYI